MQVYQTTGDKMFDSYAALAEALDKDVNELTKVERALV
jgi:hypothetical protein